MLSYLRVANNNPDALVFGGGFRRIFSWHLASIGLMEEAALTTTDTPEFLAWSGRVEEAVELAEAVYAGQPNALAAGASGVLLAYAGYDDRAKPRLETFWSHIGERLYDRELFSAQFAETLFSARLRAGDTQGAAQVIDELRANVRRMRDAGITVTERDQSVDYQEGLAMYLAGDRVEGLQIIARAVDDGLWVVPMYPFQEARFRDPAFAAILAVNKSREDRERARLLDVVCNDNPYANVWQPMPETCEAHFAAAAD